MFSVAASEEEDNSSTESGCNQTEVIFIPDDSEMLDTMYQAMCDCQVLHPDPGDSFSEGAEYITFIDCFLVFFVITFYSHDLLIYVFPTLLGIFSCHSHLPINKLVSSGFYEVFAEFFVMWDDEIWDL